MTFPYIGGINLIPASGEFVYDTIAYSGQQPGGVMAPINTYHAPGGTRTDVMYALDQLQTALPDCTSVALVVQWLGNSLDASQCKIYPSSTFIGGGFQPTAGGSDSWRFRCDPGDQRAHSDQQARWRSCGLWRHAVRSIRRALPAGDQAARAQGLALCHDEHGCDRTALARARHLRQRCLSRRNLRRPELSWLRRDLAIHTGRDKSDRALLGQCARLHLSSLRSALRQSRGHRGGVSVFAIGSELRGLEAIRGPAWTPAGTTDASGNAVWDYPFVAGLVALANDCRSVFDAAGLTRNLATRANLITYSADWSQWTGMQHARRLRHIPASRQSLRLTEHGLCFDRQLHAAVRLDHGNWRRRRTELARVRARVMAR